MKSNNINIAGWLWSVSTIIVVIAIMLYVFAYRGSMDAGADKTAHLMAIWPLASGMWRLEFIGVCGMAIAGGYFALVEKSLGWLTVFIGQLITIIMYAIMLGGYPIAGEVYEETPAIMEALNNIAIQLFTYGNLLLLAGLAGIFFSSKILPKWLSLASGALAILMMCNFAGIFFGWITFGDILILEMMAPFFFLFTAFYGLLKIGIFRFSMNNKLGMAESNSTLH